MCIGGIKTRHYEDKVEIKLVGQHIIHRGHMDTIVAAQLTHILH